MRSSRYEDVWGGRDRVPSFYDPIAVPFFCVKRKAGNVSHKMYRIISIPQFSRCRMTVCSEKQAELKHSLVSCSDVVLKQRTVVCTHRYCYYCPVTGN